MDEDLEEMTREELVAEAKRLRAGIRAHRLPMRPAPTRRMRRDVGDAAGSRS